MLASEGEAFDNAVSMLQNGAGSGSGSDVVTVAFNPLSSGTNPYTIVYSSAYNIYTARNPNIVAFPNYYSTWPGMAFASPTMTVCLLETKCINDNSRMDAYANNAKYVTSLPSPYGSFDWVGVAATGVPGDVAVVNGLAI